MVHSWKSLHIGRFLKRSVVPFTFLFAYSFCSFVWNLSAKLKLFFRWPFHGSMAWIHRLGERVPKVHDTCFWWKVSSMSGFEPATFCMTQVRMRHSQQLSHELSHCMYPHNQRSEKNIIPVLCDRCLWQLFNYGTEKILVFFGCGKAFVPQIILVITVHLIKIVFYISIWLVKICIHWKRDLNF